MNGMNYPGNWQGGYPGNWQGGYPGNYPMNYPGNYQGYPGNYPMNYPNEKLNPKAKLFDFDKSQAMYSQGYGP